MWGLGILLFIITLSGPLATLSHIYDSVYIKASLH